MLHTFLRCCSYTEHRRGSLRLQADRSSMDQGHNIAMERKACPLISDVMVYCKGIEHYPYFTDQFTYLLFYSLLLPRSHPFFFVFLQMYHFTKDLCVQIYIYVSTYTYAYIYTETDQDSKYFIIHCLLFYQHHFFTQRPFCQPLYFVSALLWDIFFPSVLGLTLFQFWLDFFFFQGGGEQTHSKLFFCWL